MAGTAKGNEFVKVKGYTNADGTKVHPHDRSTPDTSKGPKPGKSKKH
jgi:hypothetical protein